MKNIKISIFTLLFILLTCHFSRGQSHYSAQGMASYYASEFHGKRTASGEKYNMNALTAAHPSLPFNTYLKVTNLTNRKSVIVRVNDRGPFSKKRIIDLSKAAAKEIGLIQAGVTRVKIEIVNPKNKEKEDHSEVEMAVTEVKPTTPTQVAPGFIYDCKGKKCKLQGFVIQISSYSDFKAAIEQAEEIKQDSKIETYCEAAKVKSKTVYRVLAGSYKLKSDAQKDLQKLKKSGKSGYIRKLQ